MLAAGLHVITQTEKANLLGLSWEFKYDDNLEIAIVELATINKPEQSREELIADSMNILK